MLPQEIIRRKRDGGALSAAEIASFVDGIAGGRIGEGQMAAFAMAVLLNGMTDAEKGALTRAMAGSGTILDWAPEKLGGPVLDKHSTGGVGDKVSLILAPIVAACGGFVPMLTGRGLGHTGGTLDKLAAIPGYEILPDLDLFRRVVREAGCAIIGATEALAPADKRLYAVRDVTGTVESIDLITASILAKKLAAGLDALVMDVKIGSGAFLPQRAHGEALARSIVTTAAECGLNAAALLTDMNQVLGRSAGNAVEVAECLAVLRDGTGDPRLLDVTLALSAELLALGGLASDAAEGRVQAEKALRDGRAAERFARMVAALGGPSDLIENPERHLMTAPVTLPVQPAAGGRIAAIDVRAIGLAIVALGGGRVGTEDAIDPAVGLTAVAGPGETVGPGHRPIALVHARDRGQADRARDAILAATRLVPAGATVEELPLVAGRIAR